jgi:arylsulfatase
VLAVILVGCRRDDPKAVPVPISAPAARLPSVVLITIDTLRADRLGCYGHTSPTSPIIDRLATEGILFRDVIASSAATGPSVASIMTGQYPRFTSFGYSNMRGQLSDDEDTLAERFKTRGYDTAGFVCNPVLDRGANMQQGFDHFDDDMREFERVRSKLRERTAQPATDAVLKWLADRRSDRPLFLWVHYQDPHGPYDPPAEFVERFRPGDPGPELTPCPEGSDLGQGCVPWYQQLDDAPHLNDYVGRYEAEIAYVDHHVGRLLDHLRMQGWYEKSVLILTSDHGEALGEEDVYFRHGHNVTRDLSFVPMILKHPDAAAGAVSDVPVGHIDIAATLNAILGLPPHADDVTSAIDLSKAAASAGEPRVLYSDIGTHLAVHAGGLSLIGGLATRKADLNKAPSASGYKPQLLSAYQSKPFMAIDDPARRQPLESAARAYLRRPAATFRIVDPDARRRRDLGALGYFDEED